MARITIEDCLDSESNRFKLSMLASERAKQILDGSDAVVDTRNNKAVVSSLREIAENKVYFTDDALIQVEEAHLTPEGLEPFSLEAIGVKLT